MKMYKSGMAEAQRQFHKGGNLDSNPFPKGSKQYDEYMWEMHKLENMDFQGTHQEIRAGI